jgi:hypothetical protein
MTETVTYDLGRYRSRTYILHGEDSSPHAPSDDFVVTVYYRDEERDENVEIARVDTAHGFTHFDRLYRRGEPKERVEWDFWEAMDHLDRNWRTYAESFEKK